MTKLNVHTNLSELKLKEDLDATETIKNYSLKADDRMLDNARMYISKIASKRRRNLKVGIVYINGWQH